MVSESTGSDLAIDPRRRHPEGCGCTRCVGFQPGHGAALKHGANSTLAIAPGAAELADELRQVVPTYSPADEVSVRLLAVTLARIERAVAALESGQTTPLQATRSHRISASRLR